VRSLVWRIVAEATHKKEIKIGIALLHMTEQSLILWIDFII